MKNYNKLGIQSVLVENVKNAFAEQYSNEVETAKRKLINHFVSKGYKESEVKIETFIDYSDEWSVLKLSLKLVASVDSVKRTEFAEISGSGKTIKISAYELSDQNSKTLNNAIKAIIAEKDKIIAQFVSECESRFLQLSELPDATHSAYSLNMNDHGCEGTHTPRISTGFGSVDLTDNMKEHFDKLLSDFTEKRNAEKAKREAEAAELEAKKESGKQFLLTWSKENGSDLLKLRIAHNQNWFDLANGEYAQSLAPDFNDDPEADEKSADWWTVKNATLEQLQELDTACKQYPDFSITIERRKYNDYGEISHKTFLCTEVKTPVLQTVCLYKEISDVSEDDDE
jgi:hypothetical protein